MHRRAASPRPRRNCLTPPTAWSIAWTLPRTVTQLSGIARAEGRSVFQLRLLDADGHVVDSAPVPQQTLPGTLRMLVRASAPGPELKPAPLGRRYRHPRAGTGRYRGRCQRGDGAVALDAASLARSDLLLLDERSLTALSAGWLPCGRRCATALAFCCVVQAHLQPARASAAGSGPRRCRAMAAATPSNFPAMATARSSPHDAARSPPERCQPATARRLTAARTVRPARAGSTGAAGARQQRPAAGWDGQGRRRLARCKGSHRPADHRQLALGAGRAR